MTLAQALAENGIEYTSGGYRSAILQMRVNLKLEESQLKCSSVTEIVYWEIDSVGNATTPERDGVICCTEKGLLFLCPADDAIATAKLVRKFDIRVYGYKSKLFKTIFTIKLSDGGICFSVPKKIAGTLDKEIEKVRI